MVDSAELFEAIAHPVRIKIIKILEKQPASFASLKRQLGIESSGNLDYHLKKLGGLVAVRGDGLYGLTDAGKEALLSIDAGEIWAETERRKIKTFGKMPKEAFALGLLEICSSTALIFWFLLPQIQLPFSTDSLWGYIFFGALVLTGFRSGFGVFLRLRWSWTMILAKSALIMSMSLFLLDCTWKHDWVVKQSIYPALLYLAFAAAETAAVFLALRHPTKEYLGIRSGVKLPPPDLIGSLLCIPSGILLILLESVYRFPESLDVNTKPHVVSTVFASMSDSSILCGLLIIVGGLLILVSARSSARSSMLGAIISIIFGVFPSARTPFSTPPIPTWLPQQITFHTSDFIWKLGGSPAYVSAVVVGSLPIVGGLFALYTVWQKIRT